MLFLIPLTYLTHSPTAVRQQKELKGIQTIKEEVKLPLCAGDRIFYIENLKDSTKKLVERIHEFSEATGYKSNVQKTCNFITSNEVAEREINYN